ncbi:MAG: hypothetical protein WAV05_00185 [Anaerolineales bacterium]
MDFGYVLKRAWEIIWKFKVLWIFGILASCGQASTSSGSNSGYRFSYQDTNVGPQIQNYFNQLNPAISGILIMMAIIVAIILVVVVILLATVGRIGLIRGTVKAEQGTERLMFGELWRDGLTYFWRVFGLNLVIGILVILALLVLFTLGIILTVGTLGIFLVCLIPLLCLLVPVMWLVSIIIEQANVALVVENLSITEAIKRGWQVFINNIGSMIVMGLILTLGVSVIGGFIVGLPLLAVAAPAAFGIASGVTENIRNGLILSGVFFVIYLPFLLVFSGILRAYTASGWTLTYLRLTTKPLPPAIEAPVPPESPQTPTTKIEPPMIPEPPQAPEVPTPPSE